MYEHTNRTKLRIYEHWRRLAPVVFFGILMLFCASAPHAVYAQVGGAIDQQTRAFAGTGGASFAPPTDPRLIVARIISIALTLIGTLFLGYTVYAGYLILTSAGEEEKVNKGKSTIHINAKVAGSYSFSSFPKRFVMADKPAFTFS